MLRRRVRRLLATVRREIHDALQETHTPRQVAASFALGIFITALPTLGTGVLLFFAITYVFSNVSRIALFASVIVLNPVAKWGVYGASFWLGSEFLGPVSGVSVDEISLSAGPQIVERLLIGNLVIAVAFTGVAYVAGYRFTVEYRRRADDARVSVLERYYERAVTRLPGGTGTPAPTDAAADGGQADRSTDAAADGGSAERPPADSPRD